MLVGLVATPLLLGALTACSGSDDGSTGDGTGPVAVDSPALGAAGKATCARLVAVRPQRLDREPRRPVSPSDAPAAAWGDPAITLTCGTTVPAEFNKFSECQSANGVGWFVPPDQIDDGTDAVPPTDVTLTAVGYRPVVTVQVPASYRPEGPAAIIAQLARPVRTTLELVRPCR